MSCLDYILTSTGAKFDIEEDGSGKFTITFYNTAGEGVTPTTITYSLYRENGDIVNSKEDVSVTPDTSVSILIYGDDCQGYSTEENWIRKLVIKWTYTDGAVSNVPGRFVGKFDICPVDSEVS